MSKRPALFGLLTFITYIHNVDCNYRSFSVNNVDVCRGRKKSIGIETILNTAGIEVGEGAAILELKNPSKQLQSSYRNKLKECEIKFQAPTGYGIIAYIEQMNMRRHDRDLDCIDYIQFGQDDPVPFYTLKKSQKMCGMKDGKSNSSHGFFYDDPTGKLLVWIGLGGRRKTSHWNEISEVSLSLVITAYKKRCTAQLGYPNLDGKFSICGDSSDHKNQKCILKDYFCDRRFNCPRDKSSPPDTTSDELGCNYDKLGLEETTKSPGLDDGGSSFNFGNLNLISLTLIIICLLCVPLILCLAVLQIRKIYSTRGSGCCWFKQRRSERTSCELPEGGPQSLVQLSSQRQRHQNESEQNVYLPLTTFLDQPISQDSSHLSANREINISADYTPRQAYQHAADFPEEPPPAYNDLFPEGYRDTSESLENLTTQDTAHSIQSVPLDSSTNIVSEPTGNPVQIETSIVSSSANRTEPSLETSQIDD